MPIPIDDPADPRLEPYQAIRDRDVKGRRAAFVAESAGVVRALLSPASRFTARSILLSQAQAAAKPDIVAMGKAAGVPVYAAPQDMLDAVAGFPVHRGVLAEGDRTPRAPFAVADSQGPALILALIGIANHDNVGALIRTASAFGAAGVLLDETSCDPLYRKAIRVSTGSALTLPWRQGGSAHDVLDALDAAGFCAFGLSPSAPTALANAAFPDRLALVVGAEGPGLPADVLERATGLSIPMAPSHDSLNVAVAAGIALHAARTALDARADRPTSGP